MSLNNLKPDLVAGQLLARLNDGLVAEQVSNTDYQGAITSFGQSVRINQVGAVTINSYTMGSTSDITIEQLDTAAQILQINQSKYYGFTIDDADNAQARIKILMDGINEAAWGLRDAMDAYVFGLYGQAGVAVGGTASAGKDITSTNVLKYFVEADSKLSETNTPRTGRWAILPPWLVAKLALAGVVQKTNNDETFSSGRVGRVFGFDVYESNNITALSGTDRYPCLFGYRGAVATAKQLLSNEVVRPSKQFVDLAKGLFVYGAKVTRPNNLGVLFADYTEEAT